MAVTKGLEYIIMSRRMGQDNDSGFEMTTRNPCLAHWFFAMGFDVWEINDGPSDRKTDSSFEEEEG